MKTLRTIFTAILLVGFMTSANALTPLEDKVNETKKELSARLQHSFSQNDIEWDLQKNTEVVAEIYVNMNGNPEVIAINGDIVYKAYVEKQLKNMKIDKDALLGKTFIGRFKFRTN